MDPWTTSPAAVLISWDSWDPSDDHFPRMPRKHWSIPSYQVVSITVTVSFTVPLTLSWEDCNLSSTPQPGWFRTGGSSTILLLCWGITPLASHPSAYRFQDLILCLQRPSWSWSDIPQPHLQSGPRGRRQGSSAICYSRRPDCASNQDSSLWAQKLPCLGTGRLELAARGYSNSGTIAGTFQIYVENTFISPCICLAALAALLWLG